jgi:hypothetical protein
MMSFSRHTTILLHVLILLMGRDVDKLKRRKKWKKWNCWTLWNIYGRLQKKERRMMRNKKKGDIVFEFIEDGVGIAIISHRVF